MCTEVLLQQITMYSDGAMYSTLERSNSARRHFSLTLCVCGLKPISSGTTQKDKLITLIVQALVICDWALQNPSMLACKFDPFLDI